MITCMKCMERHSDPDHACLESMTLEELFESSKVEVARRLVDAVGQEAADEIGSLLNFDPNAPTLD